jgi:dihydrofolate reductase
MTGKVFFSVTMSLDGYMAPDSEPGDIEALRRGERTPSLERWITQWSRLQAWVFPTRFFRENQRLGEGGEEGRNNELLAATFERTGATIIGKRMFEGGEVGWNEEAPFHTPVYVLTHEQREPWVRPGGTTFYFVNDGPEAALALARETAGERDVRVGGGGETIQQFLNAGLVDEFTVAIAPVLLGTGVSLFANLEPDTVQLTQSAVEPTTNVTHATYAVA